MTSLVARKGWGRHHDLIYERSSDCFSLTSSFAGPRIQVKYSRLLKYFESTAGQESKSLHFIDTSNRIRSYANHMQALRICLIEDTKA